MRSQSWCRNNFDQHTSETLFQSQKLLVPLDKHVWFCFILKPQIHFWNEMWLDNKLFLMTNYDWSQIWLVNLTFTKRQFVFIWRRKFFPLFLRKESCDSLKANFALDFPSTSLFLGYGFNLFNEIPFSIGRWEFAKRKNPTAVWFRFSYALRDVFESHNRGRRKNF